MRSFDSAADLAACVGQEVVVSDWVEVTQARIDAFADATDDHQWIHVDRERCRRESPYGVPVAHGFLTLSLISGMVDRSLAIRSVGMVINYGLNRVRFPAPLPAGSRVRARLKLADSVPFAGGLQLGWEVTMEREVNQYAERSERPERPVCSAALVMRVYDQIPAAGSGWPSESATQ